MSKGKEDIAENDVYKLSLTDMSKEIRWLDRKLYLTSQKDNAKARVVMRNINHSFFREQIQVNL